MNALGHDAKWIPDNKLFAGAGNGINIVIEGFSPWSVAELASARANGARFLILATEEPTDKGFNHGTQSEMARRQEIFPEAAKHCDGILHLVPGENVTRWYSQFGVPAAYADLGYARTLVRPDAVQPEFDFGFYGSLTPRRLKILKKLAKMIGTQKAVKLVVDFETQDERDREMQRAKVIVQVRKFEEMGLVSSSRCATALSIGRPVVAEPHELAKPWDEVGHLREDDGRLLLGRADGEGGLAGRAARRNSPSSRRRCRQKYASAARCGASASRRRAGWRREREAAINLHSIVSSAIGKVNPQLFIGVRVSVGNSVAADASVTPAYATPGNFQGSIDGDSADRRLRGRGRPPGRPDVHRRHRCRAARNDDRRPRHGCRRPGTYMVSQTQTVPLLPMTAAVNLLAQVQALSGRDLRQIEGLNLQGTLRAVYLNGVIDGIVRVALKGGDLITLPDGSVVGWSPWCRSLGG